MSEVVSVDARSGERRVVAQDSTPCDVAAAAAQAWVSRHWLEHLGRDRRADVLESIASSLEAEDEHIVDVADRETALGQQRLRSELRRTCYQVRFFAEVVRDGGYLEVVIDHANPHAVPAPSPDLRRMVVPIGPVGVFGASNFPLAFSVPGGDTASALAAGCPVVVKAHSAHPETSMLCADAITSALRAHDAPPGVFALIHGHDAGAGLVTAPSIKAIGFTGSLDGGRALFDLAAARPEPIPFYGELGSLNPIVVTPAAAAERASNIGQGVAASVLLGTGQFCTKPGVVFVPASDDGARVAQVTASAAADADAGHMLTQRIRDAFRAGIRETLQVAGVEVLVDASDTENQTGAVVARVTAERLGAHDADALLQERFGPFVLIASYADDKALEHGLNALPPALTGTVHVGAGNDPHAAGLVDMMRGRAGRVIVNGYPTGVAVSWAMHHGGPYPATTSSHASVGATAIRRWLRPVAYQSTPQSLLPQELRDDALPGIPRRVDGHLVAGR